MMHSVQTLMHPHAGQQGTAAGNAHGVTVMGGPTATATQARLAAAGLHALKADAKAPESLTCNIPHPEHVMKQKEGFVKNLDDQLKGGASVLEQQVQAQRDELSMQAEREKQAFNLRVDQQVRTQQMEIEHTYSQQVKELKKQALQQRSLLEQQALQLGYEYQDRKSEEDHMHRQYTLATQQRALHEAIHSSEQQLSSAAETRGHFNSGVQTMSSGMVQTMHSGMVQQVPTHSYVPPVTSQYVTPTHSYAPAVHQGTYAAMGTQHVPVNMVSTMPFPSMSFASTTQPVGTTSTIAAHHGGYGHPARMHGHYGHPVTTMG